MTETTLAGETPTSARLSLFVSALVLVFLGSACTSEGESELDPNRPTTTSPSNSTSTRPTSTSRQDGTIYPCDTSVGGNSHLDPLGEVPRRQDIPGAGPLDEEETPNEEELPPTPDDPDGVVPDLSGLPSTIEAAQGAQGELLPDDLVLYQQPISIDGRGNTNTVAEPDVAFDGDNVLLTWNQFAGFSNDGGASFQYFDPRQFPRVDGGFCCDQLALHVPSHDLWLWYIQYWKDETTGENTIRLAYTDDAGFSSGDWSYLDWTPESLGLTPGTWIDFPHMATSNRYLYMTTNSFQGERFAQSIVIRVPLDALVPGASRAVPADCMIPMMRASDGASYPLASVMPTKGATTTMYLATHVSNTTLGIFTWLDEADSPSFVTITDFNEDGTAIKYPATSGNDYACPRESLGPPTDWCPRSDDRLTSAWAANGHLGFAWNARQEGANPYPYVWVVVLDESGVESCADGTCVLDYPHMYLTSAAIQYAGISENPRGELGSVALLGGGNRYLSCVALVYKPGVGWTYVPIGVSNADLPVREEAISPVTGDYLGVASAPFGSTSWIGSCMSFAKGSETDPGAMLVHVARFGLLKDDPLG